MLTKYFTDDEIREVLKDALFQSKIDWVTLFNETVDDLGGPLTDIDPLWTFLFARL